MPIFLPFLSGVRGLPLILLTYAALSMGAISTATIDDTEGDSQTGAKPTYSPATSFSANSDCDNCVVHADPAQAFDGTWHDSSQFSGQPPVSVTLTFTGTGIDVFCILANTLPNTVTRTDLVFLLDGASQQPYSHLPDSTTSDYAYNQRVLSVSGLAQASHQLVISTNAPSGSGTLFLFDYARYTFDNGVSDPPPPPSPPPPPPPSSSTTSQTVNVVTTTATTTTSTAKITTTDAQKSLITKTISGSVVTVSAPTPSAGSGGANFSPSAESSILGISTPLSDSPFPSSTSASSSSFPSSAVSASASTKFKYAAVLAGTLIPVFLIAVAAIIFCRRRRAHRLRNFGAESQSGLSFATMLGSQRSPTSSGYTGSLHGGPSMVSTLDPHPATFPGGSE
ncbi:hypothetical protein FB451DRAFT_439302 [Mycena latifolia]|nr:hypothetical protein FB451DRAFT_439302 [Mycena latifolia]